MPDFLTFLSEFVVLSFALIVVTDFAAGLERLWKAVATEERKLPAPASVTVTKCLTQPEPQAAVFVLQEEQLETSVPLVVNDPRLRYSHIVTPTCCHTTAIDAPMLLLTPPALEVAEPPVEVATKASKKAKAPETAEAGLTQMNAIALRKLCGSQNIKWRNAHAKGKHLNKAEMIAKLTA